MRFISEGVGNNPFSGVLKGADYGYIRLSSATKPDSKTPLTAGFGLKFLRDGVDSANLVAMLGVDGQPGNWNFFANSFTTTIGSSDNL